MINKAHRKILEEPEIMASDAIDERRKALEEDFFRKQNEQALKRLKERTDSEKPRLSPISGEPMEQLTIMGVVVDRCPTSKGIWLDDGELDQLLAAHENSEGEAGAGILKNFLNTLAGK